MGLDIIAYKELTVIEPKRYNPDTMWRPGESMIWSETHFKGRGEGIEPLAYYKWNDLFHFRAGTYSGYNEWREKLDKFRQYLMQQASEQSNETFTDQVKDADGHMFMELIDFADNEGVIGPVVSKKLHHDFKVNEKQAQTYAKTIENGDYWLEKYALWQKAFDYAKDDGAVEFR